MKKGLWIGLGIVLITICTYFFVSFFGLPWKKQQVANELEIYLEEKYNIQVSLKERYYNFKGMSYGATFTLDDNTDLSFTAEKYRNGKISDYYAESVWVRQVENDVTPILDKSFSSLVIESYSVNPVYGMGDMLVKEKNIPSYKTV